jgi:hypothetical protein
VQFDTAFLSPLWTLSLCQGSATNVVLVLKNASLAEEDDLARQALGGPHMSSPNSTECVGLCNSRRY